jgi:hypothetical protein
MIGGLYTATANRAAATIARKGGLVTFGRAGQSSYDPATDTWSGASTASASGPAVQVRSNPAMLMALELVLTSPITLLVAAANLAFVPQPADTFVWTGVTYTVKLVQDTAPDGYAILYKVTGGR